MFDQLVSGISSKLGLGDKGGPLLTMVIGKLMEFAGNNPDNLVAKFKEAGLGDQIESWIGGGANKSISGDEAEKVLGSDFMDKASKELNMERGEVKSATANVLPEAVDKLTPNGLQGLLGGLQGASGGLGGMLGGLGESLGFGKKD